MRFKSGKTDDLKIFAVSGVNTVSFGISATAKATKGLLGFALKRRDLSGGGRPRMLAISLVLLFVTPVLHAETGIVFIHGKGSPELRNQGTAFAYWGTDMVRTIAPVGQTRALVCHYDGTKSMRLAADDVAHQITTWLQRADNRDIDKLIVVTHSFGGVIVRRILSHRARYGAIIDRITRVYSIAPPNRGSEAADLARTLSSKWYSEWIADLAGQDNPATKDCTTDMMKHYNQSVLLGTNSRRPLPKPLLNIAGIDVRNDGTHEEDRGLSWLVKFVEFGDRSDGMVAAYSAQAVGQPLRPTDANHHHNRRNDYRKIGDRLATEVRR
jgi:pimeloyl-ACP methyl ester carboxylesterase